ncbi:MAG: hypothetical protein MUO37_11545 [Methyloceanibacter sp.]|jgi:hypothetical protein|nr:hypothetical protein [Methyloceanibacter sp.]
MLRSALALLSSLQVGLRIKESVERSLRQAVVVAVAAVLLIGAAAFGLLAAYQALVAHGFTPAEAAGIVAAALALLGVLILATLPLFARKRKPQAPSMLAARGEGAGMLEQGVGQAMQQVGPVTLLAIAFVAGLLASRRK